MPQTHVISDQLLTSHPPSTASQGSVNHLVSTALELRLFPEKREAHCRIHLRQLPSAESESATPTLEAHMATFQMESLQTAVSSLQTDLYGREVPLKSEEQGGVAVNWTREWTSALCSSIQKAVKLSISTDCSKEPAVRFIRSHPKEGGTGLNFYRDESPEDNVEPSHIDVIKWDDGEGKPLACIGYIPRQLEWSSLPSVEASFNQRIDEWLAEANPGWQR